MPPLAGRSGLEILILLRRLLGLLLLLGGGLHRRLHPVHCGLKLLGIANATQEHQAGIVAEEGKAAKITVSPGQGRASRRARSGNHCGKLNGVHAAAGQDLMWVMHEPKAIVAVCDAAGGDHRPSAAVCGRSILTAPELGLGNIRRRLREPVLIEEDLV